MRRLILAAIAMFGLSATAQAQWAQPPVQPPSPPSTNMYGWNKKYIFWKKDNCGSSGCKTGHCGTGGHGAGYGAPQGGTLVFPNHPFVRSPRDFFMWEPGR